MDLPEPLQQALGDSLTSGKFIDTKLWAFSSRNGTTGRVGNPQPLYANGRVLGSLPHFQRGQCLIWVPARQFCFDSELQSYLGKMT